MESELSAQEFIAARGDYKLAIRVDARGEGHLKVDGRKISPAENAKDRRQALHGLADIAEQYVNEHAPKLA